MAIRRITFAEMHEDPTEEWRDVPGFPGYRVSNKGRVVSYLSANGRGGMRSLQADAKLLRSGTDVNGYGLHRLSDATGKVRNVLVHRLVLLAFVGPRLEGTETRHLDGDPNNNRLDNLAYGSKLENMADRTRHGRVRGRIPEADIVVIRRLRASGMKLRDLSMRFGISGISILRICTGKTWKHVTDPPAEASA